MSEAMFIVVSIFLLLLGNGFFSGSEIAVISARRSRIEALVGEKSKAAQRVKELQDNMDHFLATAQIGVTVMGTLAGVLGGYLASRHLDPWLRTSPLARYLPVSFEAAFIVGLGIVYVELVLGELVPKALALQFTETVALLVSWPFQVMSRASRLLVAVLTASTRGVLRLCGVREFGGRTFVSEEEIKHLVREGRQQGVLNQTEMELIHSVFEFTDTPVRKVMVPRPKIFALDANTPPDEVGSLIVESGFSRIPAYEGSVDNIVGLLYVKDALRLLEKRQPVVVRKILHPVHFVPETKKVGPLLKELQKRRTHMAVVIDEHGSVTGLVTLEDLLEEIVGEIQDEYDWEERPVERLRDGSLVVEGTVTAAELREGFQVPLPESPEFETVAGFMLDRLGSVPKGGEVVTVGDYRLTVVDVERNRISKVKIEKAPASVKA
ncbi:MAG TPA: hemolysin family protein [Vicinamibacteria bacterium]|jgi:putative hemolysin|nr:hemolysin family protein [Vicinamibacteria bacterium]